MHPEIPPTIIAEPGERLSQQAGRRCGAYGDLRQASGASEIRGDPVTAHSVHQICSV
jgi:hypothetical protein